MTTLTIHQVGYRDGRPIARSVTASMGPSPLTDPVRIAMVARSHLIGGRWRQHAKQGSNLERATAWLSTNFREALTLPRWAIYAMSVEDASKACCRWQAARLYALTSFEPPSKPTEATLALLGKPCHGCASWHALVDRIEQVRAETPAERTAAHARARGPLVASADARTPRGWNSQDPLLDLAVLRARLRTQTKIPPPAYYRRRVEPGDPAPPRRRTMRRAVVPQRRGRP
jgi:hypothetical protein